MQRSVEQLLRLLNVLFISIVSTFAFSPSLSVVCVSDSLVAVIRLSFIPSLVFFFLAHKYYLNCSLNCNLKTNAINIQTKGKKFGNSHLTRKLANRKHSSSGTRNWMRAQIFSKYCTQKTSFDFSKSISIKLQPYFFLFCCCSVLFRSVLFGSVGESQRGSILVARLFVLKWVATPRCLHNLKNKHKRRTGRKLHGTTQRPFKVNDTQNTDRCVWKDIRSIKAKSYQSQMNDGLWNIRKTRSKHIHNHHHHHHLHINKYERKCPVLSAHASDTADDVHVFLRFVSFIHAFIHRVLSARG